MKVIGLTGGIGAGKSTIGALMEEKFSVRLLMSDHIGHLAMNKGENGYYDIIKAFGREILTGQEEIDRQKLSSIVFDNQKKLEQLNGIIHPWVRNYVEKEIEKERNAERYKYFVLESAILLESGFDNICDEVWYVDADEEIRRKRLKESRNYSDKKINDIFESQRKVRNFKDRIHQIIENNDDMESVCSQLEKLLVYNYELCYNTDKDKE